MENLATKTQIRKMFKMTLENNNKQTNLELWWDFIKGQDEELVRQVVRESMDARHRLQRFINGDFWRNKIRKYCNMHLLSDVQPYEVIRVISDKCVEVRAMDSELVKAPQDFMVGGFSAHCADNHSQKWNCTSCEHGKTMRVRLTKKGWRSGSLKFRMSDAPVKFYDYNF